MISSTKRMFTKSFTWRVFAFIVLSVIAYLTTGSAFKAGVIAAAYHLLQLFMYYLHERVWDGLAWGKSKGLFIQMTGMSGAGKTTLAMATAERLRKRGLNVEIIDGDEYRTGLCKDLGFSKEDRNTNIRRLGFVGRKMAEQNVVVLMSAINPYESIRQELTEASDRTKLVYVRCGLEKLKDRDTKGLYRRALLPKDHEEHIPNFTGISDIFEAPAWPDRTIDTEHETLDESVSKLERFVLKNVGK